MTDQIQSDASLKSRLNNLVNKNTLKNIVIFSGGIILFTLGVLAYGIILKIREVPLGEAIKSKGFSTLTNPNLIIERHSFSLNLYEDTVLIKSYRANFGRNLKEPKQRSGDEATPVGNYNVCKIDTSHKYYIFMRLNYPNINDASEALRKNLITQKQYDQLKFEFYYEGCPKANTVLGGNVGIHGIGEYNDIIKNLPFVFNWTDGSIALSNEDIKEIYSVIKEGTKVVIK
jgi:murein L,D-transpeptidase YafK